MNHYFNISLFVLFILVGCTKSDNDPLKNLNSCKNEFIAEILKQSLDESPFHMNYSLKTVLFSDNLISLFEEISIYNDLPHDEGCYKGITFYKKNGTFLPLTLQELFSTPTQKEWLRSYCEQFLKTNTIAASYFSGEAPFLTFLEPNLIRTFVLESEALCIIFQPYTVAGGADGPPIIKISYQLLKNHWNPSNPLSQFLPIVHFTSSWHQASESFGAPLPN